MPLLILLLIGVGFFFIVKYIAVITTVTAIIISGITVSCACKYLVGNIVFLEKIRLPSAQREASLSST